MELRDRVVVVTGGASGIGRALCRRFAAEGASVTVSDVNVDGALATVASIEQSGGRAQAVGCDVRIESDVQELVRAADAAHGPIDLFCSNAGIAVGGGPEVPDATWARAWETNVLAHVYGVRAVLPGMLDRGSGYLLHTASAAGLLTQVGDLPYSVTKHAVVSLAEWLAITYGDAGIRVSCVCPQYVRTAMTTGSTAERSPDARRITSEERMRTVADVLEPEDVADAVVAGIGREEFLILPHTEVREYFRRKADDYERWLGGMRRLQARLDAM